MMRKQPSRNKSKNHNPNHAFPSLIFLKKPLQKSISISSNKETTNKNNERIRSGRPSCG